MDKTIGLLPECAFVVLFFVRDYPYVFKNAFLSIKISK
jgi:hypothetical protein